MIHRAIEALKNGTPVLIHDSESREDEVDYVIHGLKTNVAKIREMRKLAGGLICFAMPYSYGRALGLDFLQNTIKPTGPLPELLSRKPSYGDPPAFSIWVNSRKAVTGIRDKDRALTLSVLSRVTSLIEEGKNNKANKLFKSELQAPGHVPILLGRGLSERQGHTELALALAKLAGLPQGIVLVEMLSDNGEQLSAREAARLASSRNWVYLEAREIIEEYERRGL